MSAALTRRERRVKRILLKELERMNDWHRLTYVEKQRLDKSLDVDFIDRELVKMRKQVRFVKRMEWVVWPVGIAICAYAIWRLAAGAGFDSFPINLLAGPLYGFSASLSKRSLQRKMFIYEALRELSDAEELDVQLSRAAVEADQLIERIVAREVDAERFFAVGMMSRN